MNKKVRKMMRRIERHGGIVLMPDSLPDDVVERFLQEILACPDCCAASDVLMSETRLTGALPHERVSDSGAALGRRDKH